MTEVSGTIEVCAHNVSYSYDIGNRRETPELREALKEEAESRSRELINTGCVSGELNCLWRGEAEIRGWWQIE